MIGEADARDGDSGAAAKERFAALIAPVVGTETVLAAQAMELAAGDSAGRASARVNSRELSRQANIERVIRFASDDFGSGESGSPVDPSWLDRFFEHAQDIREESEQRIWGRILAREFASPGSVSKRTLGFLSAMDSWELAGLAEYCAFAFAFESGWRFMFDEDVARREMWTYGREIDLTQHFIAIGLLSGETGVIKPRSAKGLRLCYQGKAFELRGEITPEDGLPSVGVAYRKFSAVGQQLSEALRTKSFFGYARNLIAMLNVERGLDFVLLEE